MNTGSIFEVAQADYLAEDNFPHFLSLHVCIA